MELVEAVFGAESHVVEVAEATSFAVVIHSVSQRPMGTKNEEGNSKYNVQLYLTTYTSYTYGTGVQYTRMFLKYTIIRFAIRVDITT